MNKFNHLSGDFVAEYNTALESFLEDQLKLDKKYGQIIEKLVHREKQRLEMIAPIPFEVGTKVKDTQENIGTVVDCPVTLAVLENESFHGERFGPKKYFRIEDVDDEEVITCEGIIRMVRVEMSPTDLEIDWMADGKILTFWPDELTVLTD